MYICLHCGEICILLRNTELWRLVVRGWMCVSDPRMDAAFSPPGQGELLVSPVILCRLNESLTLTPPDIYLDSSIPRCSGL